MGGGYTADNTEGIRWWRKSSRQSERGFSSQRRHVHTWKIFHTLDCLLLPCNGDIFTRIGEGGWEKGCAAALCRAENWHKLLLQLLSLFTLLSLFKARVVDLLESFVSQPPSLRRGKAAPAFQIYQVRREEVANPWRGCQNARKLLTTW